MKPIIALVFLLHFLNWGARAQVKYAPETLPDSICSGKQGAFHVQGLAVDKMHGFVYLSFTDKLLKLDLKGHLVGSVTGLTGHLGDLTMDASTGKIYGSLEYKDDAIGKGIRKELGIQAVKDKNNINFYIAIFDSKQIIRPDMDASDSNVLRTVHLKSVAEDYAAQVELHGKLVQHRFGCSGIDGITIGPAIGEQDRQTQYLYVAYGIYGDTARSDNECQVILKYDYTDWWGRYGEPLKQDCPRRSGPDYPLSRYFVRTGNTNYGIQNLEYDPATGNFFAAVYAGSKRGNPNYNLFVIDGKKKPGSRQLESDDKRTTVQSLSLLEAGERDVKTGIRGWYFKWGSTGLFPLGGGFFYISHNGLSADGQQQTTLYKYKWIGTEEKAFDLIP